MQIPGKSFACDREAAAYLSAWIGTVPRVLQCVVLRAATSWHRQGRHLDGAGRYRLERPALSSTQIEHRPHDRAEPFRVWFSESAARLVVGTARHNIKRLAATNLDDLIRRGRVTNLRTRANSTQSTPIAVTMTNRSGCAINCSAIAATASIVVCHPQRRSQITWLTPHPWQPTRDVTQRVAQ